MSNASSISKLANLASHVANLVGLSNSKASIDAKVSEVYPIPAGVILDYAGSPASVPSGWLLADGSAVSRTTYAALFTMLGTTHGAGDGSTTFNLPDARGRVIAGKDDMGGTAANRLTAAKSGITGTTLGAAGGSEEHVLTTAQMPLHGHPYRSRSDAISSPTANTGGGFLMNSGASGLGTRTAFTGTPSDTNGEQIGGTGGGAAHNNTQPTLVLNKIIKT